MTTPIKAIETRYAGCRFRSRLEARWAVYFDSLGWEWQYEPEGFELHSGRYLPDFHVHVPQDKMLCPCYFHQDLNLPDEWYEIKGQEPTEREITFALELAIKTRKQVTILGDIPRPGEAALIQGWRARCFGKLSPQRFAVYGGDNDGGYREAKMDRNNRLMKAAIAARSARFEFGESG